MNDDTAIDALERERARLLADAKAALEKAEAVARDMAELKRLAGKYNLVVSAPNTASTAIAPSEAKATPNAPNEPQRADTDTVGGLVHHYKTDPKSAYHGVTYKSREHYNILLNRIEKDHGHEKLASLNDRTVRLMHESWSPRGPNMARQLINMLRGVINYGRAVLELDECHRLSVVMHHLRLPKARRRREGKQLTAEQVNAIRAHAHKCGAHSLALAQAFQFELGFGQKAVIGEWVPLEEPGPSDTRHADKKWVNGLRWEEIDGTFILHHATGDKDLKRATMVMEELNRLDVFPQTGPVIRRESTGRPWRHVDFRRKWREIADACSIPKSITNADSRPRPANTKALSGNGDGHQASGHAEIRDVEPASEARH